MPDIYLVGFKGNRKEFFYNNFHHALKTGDYVIVQVDRGEDIGQVAKKVEGEITFPDDKRPSTVLRKANDDDILRQQDNLEAEKTAWPVAQKLIAKHQLDMKLVDVEYQLDRNKVTFFFTAEHRVDFRALVRDLASEYKTRIELRQIGVRDEAKRIGGFGICGLEQCCSSFLKSFDPISTHDARVQNLSLNPTKISGNCGRLLCCLKYEVDYYDQIMRKYPEIGSKYSAEGIEGTVDRISVFEDYMIVINENGEEFKVIGHEILKRREADEAPVPEVIPENADNSDDDDFVEQTENGG